MTEICVKTPLWKKVGIESLATYTNFLVHYLAAGLFVGGGTLAALAVGFIQGMSVYSTNSLFYGSGPHMNPFITASAALFRTSPRVKGWGILLAIIFQAGFAVLAGWTAEWMLDAIGAGYASAVPFLNTSISQGMGFYLEAFFPMIELLAFLIIAKSYTPVQWTSNNPALVLGFLHFISVSVTYQFTGGSLDVLRHFGIAILHPSIGYHHSSWIYYIGPLVGWILSVIVFAIFFRLPKEMK